MLAREWREEVPSSMEAESKDRFKDECSFKGLLSVQHQNRGRLFNGLTAGAVAIAQ